MHVQNFIDRFIESRFFSNIRSPNLKKTDFSSLRPKDKTKMGVRSATTSFVIRLNKGVLMVSDRRMMGYGYELESDQEVKIKKISPFSGLTFSGLVSLCQLFERHLEDLNYQFYKTYKKWLSPDGQVNYLKSLLEELAYLLFIEPEINTEPVLGFYDQEKRTGRIFSLQISTPYSCFCKEKFDYCGTGCGYLTAQSILRDGYNPKLKVEEAISLSMRAMYHSGKSSAGVTDLRIALPCMAVIDENEFRFISETELRPYRDKVLKKFERVVVRELGK